MKKYKNQITAIAYILLIALLYHSMSNYTYYDVAESEPIVPVSAVFNTQEEESYDILIDLTESMLYLFKGNKLIKKYAVAQGKTSTPSPVGIWEINSKARNWGTGFGTRWLGLNVPCPTLFQELKFSLKSSSF